MVTETWVKEGHFDVEVNIDAYTVHHNDKVTSGRKSKGGDVIIYTKDKLIQMQSY